MIICWKISNLDLVPLHTMYNKKISKGAMFLKWGGVWCMRSITVGKVSLQDGFKLKGCISLSLYYGTVAYTCVSTQHYTRLKKGSITICPAMNINFWFLGGVSLLRMFTTTRPHGNVNRITWLGISRYF